MTKSSTSVMLFSVLFEEICRFLQIKDDDFDSRDKLRTFGQKVWDAGVESARHEARRQTVRAENAELQIEILKKKLKI